MLGTSKSLFAVRMGLACVGVSLLALPNWQATFLVGVLLIGVGIGLGDWKGGE